MNKRELRTLKGQALLLACLFLASAVLAVFLATQRGFFEEFIEEKYAETPSHLKPLADAASKGDIDPAAFQKLSPADRLILYDDWMRRPDPPPNRTPSALLAADRGFYLARAERTIVGGSVDQKIRALRFLELGGSRAAIPLLQKARQWSINRRTAEITARITETLDRLERN